MGAIKDITELTLKLLERKSARRFVTEVLKIQSLAATLQAEQAMLLEKQATLMAENLELKRKTRELEDSLCVARKVEFHYEACWVKREDGSLEGPFSPRMWDMDRKLMRMHLARRGSASFEYVCEKSQKISTVPLNFMVKHRVLSQEELK